MDALPPMPPPPGPPPMPGMGPTSTWQPPSPSPPPRHAYAGFWQRFAALLIDGIVLVPIWAVPFFLAWDDMAREFQSAVDTNTQPDFEPFISNLIWWGIAIALVSYAYNAAMIGFWSATLGKFALGLRVRRADGSPATWREALLRPLLQAVGTWANTIPGVGLFALLDYLWMLWDPRKQTIHDKIAATIVVQKESSPFA